MTITQEEFAKENNLTLNQVKGNEPIARDLLLYDIKEIPENFTPEVKGHLRLNALEQVPSGFAPSVEKSLDLSSAESLPDNSDLTKVKGTIYLNNLKDLPTNFKVENDGDLWLNSIEKLNENFPSYFKGSLMLSSLLDLNGNNTLKTQGALWLDSIKELPENICIEAHGPLKLKALKKLPVNIDLTNITGDIYLNKLTNLNGNNMFKTKGSLLLDSIKELPENIELEVGGHLRLKALENLPKKWTISFKECVLCEHRKTRNEIEKSQLKSETQKKIFEFDGYFSAGEMEFGIDGPQLYSGIVFLSSYHYLQFKGKDPSLYNINEIGKKLSLMSKNTYERCKYKTQTFVINKYSFELMEENPEVFEDYRK